MAAGTRSRGGNISTLRRRFTARVAASPLTRSDATAVELWYYAPPEIGSRLLYLAESEASHRVLGLSSVVRGMVDSVEP